MFTTPAIETHKVTFYIARGDIEYPDQTKYDPDATEKFSRFVCVEHEGRLFAHMNIFKAPLLTTEDMFTNITAEHMARSFIQKIKAHGNIDLTKTIWVEVDRDGFMAKQEHAKNEEYDHHAETERGWGVVDIADYETAPLLTMVR